MAGGGVAELQAAGLLVWKMMLPLLCTCHAGLIYLHDGADHQQGIATMIQSEQLEA